MCKLKSARVFFVPPLTWSDYFAERVRAEGGKIQIRRQYKHLLIAGPVAKYPWKDILRKVKVREYVHVIFMLMYNVFLVSPYEQTSFLWSFVRIIRTQTDTTICMLLVSVS